MDVAVTRKSAPSAFGRTLALAAFFLLARVLLRRRDHEEELDPLPRLRALGGL